MRRFIVASVLALVAWLAPLRADAAPIFSYSTHAGRVTVRAEAGLEKSARDLAAGAETTLTRIRADLVDLPTPRSIEVRLVRDAADLPDAAPEGRGAPAYAIGVAYPDLGIISVAMNRGAQQLDVESTLEHELGHIALGSAIGDRAPHWLHEGFAYQHSGEWSWDRTETLAGMAWFNSIIDIDDLDRSFPAQESPAQRAYAESYDFVGYLSRRGRHEDKDDDGDRWPFRRFLTIVGQTGDMNQAAMAAYGRNIHQLFDEWRTDLTHRYMLAPIGLMGLAVWVLCAFLVVIAWWRKKYLNKKRIAEWDEQERQAMVRAEAEQRTRLAAMGLRLDVHGQLRPIEDDDPPTWIN
ncbi:hypothetical protein BH11MYX2_BH11MYX2_39620 [soil metagenome]